MPDTKPLHKITVPAPTLKGVDKPFVYMTDDPKLIESAKNTGATVEKVSDTK